MQEHFDIDRPSSLPPLERDVAECQLCLPPPQNPSIGCTAGILFLGPPAFTFEIPTSNLKSKPSPTFIATRLYHGQSPLKLWLIFVFFEGGRLRLKGKASWQQEGTSVRELTGSCVACDCISFVGKPS